MRTSRTVMCLVLTLSFGFLAAYTAGSQTAPPSKNSALNQALDGLFAPKPKPIPKNPAAPAGDGASLLGDLLSPVVGIPLEKELEIGGAVAVEIVSRHGGLWKDTNATQRVNLLGKAIARYSSRPGLNYRFGILDSTDVNAFSAPGGYVFITRGLYELAATDDQLGGILAHEIVHIANRHALKIISQMNAFSAVINITVSSSADMRQFGSLIESGAKRLIEKGYDDGTEFNADRDAKRLSVLTGFDGEGLCQILEKLQAQPQQEGSRKVFSTHPSMTSRIQKLHGEEKQSKR